MWSPMDPLHPSFTGCMPSHVSMWHILTKIVLSPAEQACTICFHLPGPWAPSFHHFPTFFIHFLWNSIDISLIRRFFVHEHTLLWPPSPPSSIWAISHRMAPVPLPTHQFPSNNSIFHQNFIDFSSIFRFSHMHVPDLVITTHPGLLSPSTIDWPNIPPTCWPQCHSLLHSPSFLSISIDITSNLPIHLSDTYLPTYPPTPSRLHPSI